MSQPFVSIVILVRDYHHQISLTIDSILAQKNGNFEIIIIEVGTKKEFLEQINVYGNKISHVYSVHENKLPLLMNRGLGFAKGEYVHFLLSGDAYLSKHCLSDIETFIRKEKNPDIINSSYLEKVEGKGSYVTFLPLSLEVLKKGKSAQLQSFWFSTQLLKAKKGFNEQYSYCPVYNFLCGFAQDKEKRMVNYQRILVDCDQRKSSAGEILHIAMEVICIIYRHFGLIRTIIWCFLQDRLHVFRMTFLFLKKIFWNPR